MKNINELIGIIKGVNFDGVINNKEISRLQIWVNKNRNLAYKSNQIKLIQLVDSILADKIITTEERNSVLEFCNTVTNESSNEITKIYELNGIIEGIICDEVINDAEIYRLKEWMDNYGHYVREHEPSEKICKIIDDVLSDNIITSDEKELLLNLLSNRIEFAQVETKLAYLKKKVVARKNIGIDLIDLLDNEEVLGMIHQKAEAELKKTLLSYTSCANFDREIVFISLVLIAMIHYDGNYYENVRDIYSGLYSRFSEQKIEGEIRTILSKYRLDKERTSKRSRIINIALENAIVPTHYLSSFFEFIFDIYKLNFEYNLAGDLYDDFKFVYDGLKSSMLSENDDLEINVTKKTYKLIKTTKELIVDSSNIDAVIKLSIIITNLIDKRIWNKDIRILNPYLKSGYENWEKTLSREERKVTGERNVSEIRSRWEPKFVLSHNKIYIVPPIHRIKSQYDYREIKIVIKNDNEEIHINNEPYIKEIIGGYQINPDRVEIAEPLNKLSYQLMAGKEIIYDSREKLHRNILVFDQDGNEIDNNTDFSGTAIFCTKSKNEIITTFYQSLNYCLSSKSVKHGETLLIDDVLFNFASFIKPGIFGDVIDNCILSEVETKKEMKVFRKTKFFIFECNKNISNFEIFIDGNRKRLADFNYTVIEKEGSNKYTIYVEDICDGIHNLKVNALEHGCQTNLLTVDFAVDSTLFYNTCETDDSHYIYELNSSLIGENIIEEVSINEINEELIIFAYKEKNYRYIIPFQFDIYRFRDNWNHFSRDIWIGDVSNETILEIYGNSCDEITVSSNNGTVLEENIKMKQNGVFQQMHIGFLLSYKFSCDFVNIWLMKDGKVKNILRCYNKCIWDEQTTEIYYDSNKNELVVIPGYFGKGNIYFEVSDKNSQIVHKSEILQNHTIQIIPSLSSFKKYRITFFEKAKGLSLAKDQVLKIYDYIFYARNEFVGKKLKIKEVFYDQYYGAKFNRKTHRFNYTYLKITEQITDDKFLGELYATTLKGIYKHTCLNPVEVEVCGDIIDNTIEFSLTKDGDGLLLDFEHHGVMNSLDNDSAVDIFSYIVDLNEVETE